MQSGVQNSEREIFVLRKQGRAGGVPTAPRIQNFSYKQCLRCQNGNVIFNFKNHARDGLIPHLH